MTQHVVRGQMIQRAEGDEVAVYRLFNAEEQLLYVGISKDPMNRWLEHRGRRWWRDVQSYQVEWHSSRAAARLAEKEAMVSEHPVHNIHSAPGHGNYMTAVLNTPEARALRKKQSAYRAAKRSAGE